MSSDLPLVPEPKDPKANNPARKLRNYMIGGLLIWIPIMITVWVVRFLSGILDSSLLLLPPSWRPEAVVGTYVPGVGIILSLLLLLFTGILVKNLFGGQIVAGFESLVRRIPVVGAVYGGAKTFSETVLTDKGSSFKQVVMVEFPRKGVFSIGFITAHELEEAQAKTEQEVTCVFVPTTPNPTTGFLVLVPEHEVVKLEMSVADAIKFIISLGTVAPEYAHAASAPTVPKPPAGLASP